MKTRLPRLLHGTVTAAFFAMLVSCGGEARYLADSAAAAAKAARTPDSTPPTGTPSPAAATPMAATGKTWDVTMVGDARGFRFEPAALSIKAGDAVRWTLVSGPPHNVSFWPDSIPASAAGQLAANMPESIAALTGPLRMNANDTYTVSFAGLSAGSYRYYCTPHLALGMKAVITVE